MKNPDSLWYDLIMRIGKQSKCQSRQVGCLIVFENRIIGQGYNGAPEGSNCKDCPRPKCNGESKPSGSDLDKAICAHAEQNAIGYCARHGISTRGSTIYLPIFPCSECAKLIVASGIVEVVQNGSYVFNDDRLSFVILKNANITIRKYNL
jgi:dCMP deaminase